MAVSMVVALMVVVVDMVEDVQVERGLSVGRVSPIV